VGVDALRWGPPYYRTHLAPGRYDWSFADDAFAELQRLSILPIVDLCHFGVPDWLESFQNPDFPVHLAEYARAFAERYPHLRIYTPVNEMYVAARLSAREGVWNERLASDRAFVTALKHIARANVLATEAILAVRPDARFVQSESSEYFHPASPDAERLARRRNEERFLALDLNYGVDVCATTYQWLLDHGMTREEYAFFLERQVSRVCIMGNDYYASNEHIVYPDGATYTCEMFGYYVITKQYYDRYRLPVMHTETNHRLHDADDEAARYWLEQQWANVLRLKDDGVPILGFTWYSLLDQVDWDSGLAEAAGRVNRYGLYGLDRRAHRVGVAYRELIRTWRDRVSAGVPALD
jgi:beta-glucosidase/6-phospho-beta-glucosidase/beta-galactosidase